MLHAVVFCLPSLPFPPLFLPFIMRQTCRGNNIPSSSPPASTHSAEETPDLFQAENKPVVGRKKSNIFSSSNHHVQSKKKYNMRPSLSWKQRGSLLFFLPFQQLGRAVTRALLLLLLPFTNHETAKEEKGGTHTPLFPTQESKNIRGTTERAVSDLPPSPLSSFLLLLPPYFHRRSPDSV